MDKVVFVHAGDKGRPHPVHGKFASSVSDVFVDHRLGTSLPGSVDVLLRANHLPESDIYLAENSAYLPVALKKKFENDFKLIVYFSNPVHEVNIRFTDFYTYPYKVLLRLFLSKIDGIIAASEYIKNIFEQYIDKPIEVSEPFIKESRFNKFRKISPDFSSKKIVSIGSTNPIKGLDLLVEAFKKVLEVHPRARLYLIGEGTKEMSSEEDNILGVGWKDNLVPYLRRASLHVRPSYHEGFCVASLEAMRAGIPVIVTEVCGEKELVRKIRDDFVSPINAKELAKRIERYFNMAEGDKEKLSKNFREATEPYQEKKKTLKFKRKFKKILRRINYA